jgi:hypothetical protein
LALAGFDGVIGCLLKRLESRGIGATLIDRDLVWQTLPENGFLDYAVLGERNSLPKTTLSPLTQQNPSERFVQGWENSYSGLTPRPHTVVAYVTANKGLNFTVSL